MRAPLIRRLVTVLSVLALLLTGFATASVAADVPCGMDMPAAGIVTGKVAGSAPAT
jgi:hypothetical protein